MEELRCRVCGKTLGYVKADYNTIDDEDCLCKECYEKAKNKRIDFVIAQKPYAIRLECPFCTNEVEIDWDDVPNTTSWCDIPGEEVECPHCHEYITLGDYDVD